MRSLRDAASIAAVSVVSSTAVGVCLAILVIATAG